MKSGFCRHNIQWPCHCDACELEIARERDQRLGPLVDEARKLIEQEKKREEA